MGVLLWQQRQRSCTSAVRQWQEECSEQKAARRAASGWARVWGLFGQLTWHRTGSSSGYRALQKKRGWKGKKREDTRPVWVVQLVGVLFRMCDQRLEEIVRAAVAAAGAGRNGSSGMGGNSGREGQENLAEPEVDGKETAVSTDGEQAAGGEGEEATARAEAAAGRMRAQGVNST